MDNTELDSILRQLPASQRESAERRIRAAELMGWRFIELWSWIDKLQMTEADLVGVDFQDKFRFIP